MCRGHFTFPRFNRRHGRFSLGGSNQRACPSKTGPTGRPSLVSHVTSQPKRIHGAVRCLHWTLWTLYFLGCRFSGNQLGVLNSTGSEVRVFTRHVGDRTKSHGHTKLSLRFCRVCSFSLPIYPAWGGLSLVNFLLLALKLQMVRGQRILQGQSQPDEEREREQEPWRRQS